MQFMPQVDLAHCVGMRQQFTSMDQDITTDGNSSQRANHLLRKRDLPQTPALPMITANNEFGSGSIFMDPSFFNKGKEPSPSENRSSSKPPKFLVENSKHPHHRTVSICYITFQILSLYPMPMLFATAPQVQHLPLSVFLLSSFCLILNLTVWTLGWSAYSIW
jgi:methyl-CpG-binding domain-containing protein 9